MRIIKLHGGLKAGRVFDKVSPMELLNLAAVALFNSLEKHDIDKSLLIEGTGLKMEYMNDLQKKHRWDQFVKMYENCGRLIGVEQTTKEIAYQGIHNDKIGLIVKVATSLLNVKTIYWYTATFVAKHLYKESVSFKYTKIKSNSLRMEINIHPDLIDCPMLLETYTHLFEILPTILGLPKAKVSATITERRGEYNIYVKHSYFLKLLFVRFLNIFASDDSTVELISGLETQSMELSKVIEEKSQLLRIVSHDIANQVSIIDYYLHKLTKNEDLSAEDQKSLSIAKNSSGKLYNILKNVQNLEISATRGINLVPVDIESVFLALEDQFQSQLRHKRLTLKCRSELESNVLAMGEASSLETNILGNLLTNAIKFSPEGSTIELHAKREDDKILISVIDEGMGIPLEERRTIFTQKIRTSHTGTLGESGTGFGLGIVLNYVKLFGGKISVHSNIPHGSIFVIQLDAYVPQNSIISMGLEIETVEINPRN